MRRIVPLLALAFLAACSDDIDNDIPSGTSAPLARVDLVVRDAPADELVAFVAIVESLRLGRDDGTSTDVLLDASVAVEFTGLRDRVLWLASFEIEEGRYDSVRLRFTPEAYSARSLAGDELQVQALADLLVVPLALDLSGGEYARIEVDLDLGASLSGDVASGSLTFDPRGSALASDGSVPLRIDDLDALVEARELASGALVVGAMVGDERRLALRDLAVDIIPETLLLGPAEDVFSQTALYLTLLTPGLGVVELEGFLGVGGAFLASCVELEDQNGLQGTRFPVELEGRVVARPQPNLATVLVREFTRGGEQATPVLAGLGRATIDVLVEPLPFVSASDGSLLSMDDLPVGADVEAKFTFFSAEPFQAQRLVLLSVPAPPSGEGSGASAGPAPVLDVAHRPVLAPEALPAGTRVWRSGSLALVRAGLLVDGRLRAVDVAGARLTLSAGRIVASFGGHASAGEGPFAVEVDPAARFVGAASDLGALARLLETLPPGASLVVEVRGLAAPGPGTLRAFELCTRIVR